MNAFFCADVGTVMLRLVDKGSACDDLEGRELMAVDERAPMTLCHYKMDGEREVRPLGCNGVGDGLMD